uniref:Probable imidazolonepropionase n=1 Tax=Strigamia maritima TaxID=126957 RepID=T1JDI3_STRMM
MNTYRLLIHSADQIVQVTNNGQLSLRGNEMAKIAILQKTNEGDGCSIVIGNEGEIVAIDNDAQIAQRLKNATYDKVINATGQCIIPGLIDAHTHPIWEGDRVHEFAMKIAGSSYMDIHNAGGGIGFTVKETCNATDDELSDSLTERLNRMLVSGTTLAEAKSGYGLDKQQETRLIRILNRASHDLPIDLSITYLGAHSIPEGLSSEEATEKVISEQIPALEYLKSLNISVDNIDVFCEKGVYDVDQTERILRAGKNIGLNVNFHGDELHAMGAAEMGAALGSVAISHLEEISSEGIQKMADSDSIAVLLPVTAYILGLKPPPARKMINAGIAVCLGTDFNPNCYCLSMPLAMHYACIILKMTLEEVLAAATINAAASLKKSKDYGSLEIGKKGDLLVINSQKWEHLIYQLGGHDHTIEYVIKSGRIVYKRKTREQKLSVSQ